MHLKANIISSRLIKIMLENGNLNSQFTNVNSIHQLCVADIALIVINVYIFACTDNNVFSIKTLINAFRHTHGT